MVSDEAHAALQEENSRLRAENGEQRERNAALPIQLADAVQQIGALEGQIAQHQQRIAQLEAKKTPPPPVGRHLPASRPRGAGRPVRRAPGPPLPAVGLAAVALPG